MIKSNKQSYINWLKGLVKSIEEDRVSLINFSLTTGLDDYKSIVGSMEVAWQVLEEEDEGGGSEIEEALDTFNKAFEKEEVTENENEVLH